MNLFTGDASNELFGGAPPPSVRHLLRQASTAPREQMGGLLWTAQACAPECLAVYYLLYKHHAGRREFELAERAALKGLEQAGLQAALPTDWRSLRGSPVLQADFNGHGPARFWLFTLKALAFICLRAGRREDARALLRLVEVYDPRASVGSEVIAALLAGADGC